MAIEHYVASVGVMLWWAFTIFQIHRTVMSDGTWYNQLKRSGNNTYFNRLKITATDRLNITKSVVMCACVSVIIYALLYVLTAGVIVVI